jgi:hypothetical protein
MKLILLLPAASLLLAGVASLYERAQNPTTLPEKPAVESAAKMWTDDATVYKNDILQIHFSLPHPQFLGVTDPDGHFFYVIFPAENTEGKMKPFVSSEQFAFLKTLKISTSDFKADPYTYGVLENQPVFTKSGTYRFLLGDNLHVDDESVLTVLKVNYHHIVRPHPTTAIAAL